MNQLVIIRSIKHTELERSIILTMNNDSWKLPIYLRNYRTWGIPVNLLCLSLLDHKWKMYSYLFSANYDKHYCRCVIGAIYGSLFVYHFTVLTHWGRDKIDAISETTFSNPFSWIKMQEFSLKISLKFVPKVRISNIPALVQIMAWRRPGDKPLSEPMMVSLLTHICVTRPQWVKCVRA